MLKKVAPYSKAVIAVAGALAIGGQIIADGAVSMEEAGLFATALVAAYGVYKKRNAPPAPPA